MTKNVVADSLNAIASFDVTSRKLRPRMPMARAEKNKTKGMKAARVARPGAEKGALVAKRSGRRKTDAELQEQVKQAVMEAKIVGNWTIADPPIIAQGAFGVVFRAFKAPLSNDLFALKAEVDMPTCRIGSEVNMLRRLNSIRCRTHPLSMCPRCSRVYIQASVPTLVDSGTLSLGGLSVKFHVCSMLGDTLEQRVNDNNGMPLEDVYKVGHGIVRPSFIYCVCSCSLFSAADAKGHSF